MTGPLLTTHLEMSDGEHEQVESGVRDEAGTPDGGVAHASDGSEYGSDAEPRAGARTRTRSGRATAAPTWTDQLGFIADDGPRRRSSRLQRQTTRVRQPILVVDDGDGSYSEGEGGLSDLSLDSEAEFERPKPKRPRVAPRKRAKSSHKVELVPEDVPWRDELPGQPPADPDSVENYPSVAFLVIFINTFPDLFEGVPALGPQDVETGIMKPEPVIEQLFLRLLGLVLNRKKDIEPGRYSSALGELHALLPYLGVPLQFPELAWKSKTAFEELEWPDRLELLHILAQWATTSSQRLSAMLSHLDEDAIYPWIGTDSSSNKYYFVQGQGDTQFRLYKETNRLLNNVSWRSIASTPEEIAKIVANLRAETEDSGGASATLAGQLEELLPALHESEERRIKEMRRARRRNDLEMQADLIRSGEGNYSGRTRGVKINYNLAAVDRDLERGLASRRSSRVANRRQNQSYSMSPAPAPAPPPEPRGFRLSRRLRGEDPREVDAPSFIELEAAKQAERLAAEQAKADALAAEEERRRLVEEEKARKAEEDRLAAEARAEEKRRMARERARARAAAKAEEKQRALDEEAKRAPPAQSPQSPDRAVQVPRPIPDQYGQRPGMGPQFGQFNQPPPGSPQYQFGVPRAGHGSGTGAGPASFNFSGQAPYGRYPQVQQPYQPMMYQSMPGQQMPPYPQMYPQMQSQQIHQHQPGPPHQQGQPQSPPHQARSPGHHPQSQPQPQPQPQQFHGPQGPSENRSPQLSRAQAASTGGFPNLVNSPQANGAHSRPSPANEPAPLPSAASQSIPRGQPVMAPSASPNGQDQAPSNSMTHAAPPSQSPQTQPKDDGLSHKDPGSLNSILRSATVTPSPQISAAPLAESKPEPKLEPSEEQPPASFPGPQAPTQSDDLQNRSQPAPQPDASARAPTEEPPRVVGPEVDPQGEKPAAALVQTGQVEPMSTPMEANLQAASTQHQNQNQNQHQHENQHQL